MNWTPYEISYMNMCKDILEEGELTSNRTGVDAYKLEHQIIQVDLEKELPILRTKKLFWKTAIDEILWIMQRQSNNVKDLNSHIWDQWADEDGSIGKAYGYQVKQYQQIDNLIDSLKNDPQNRRMIINLWNNHDLKDMNLEPCCLMSIWDVTRGRLNCMLIQRSGDVPVGVPFNTFQYAVLTHMLAQVTGLKPGKLTHCISNAHIYVNQVDGMKKQIDRYAHMMDVVKKIAYAEFTGNKDIQITHKEKEIYDITNSTPKLELNKDIDDFYKFTMEDFDISDYKHMGKIDFPVAK